MANFTHEAFTNYDDWITPKSAWEDIKEYIPKDKVIWEAFYANGESGTILTEMGFNIIHENIDFFLHDKGDIVISNPPFSLIPEVLKRLVQINKPFILIMPVSKINTQYFREIFNGNEEVQLIVPKKRIQFRKSVQGKLVENQKSSCSFDCFYYCWKMNLSKDLIRL
jgi:hypothetical protein